MASRPLQPVLWDPVRQLLVAQQQHGGVRVVSSSAPPASSGGTTDHAALSNLVWTASGHTGTASRFGYFDGAGAAAYVASDGATVEVSGTTLRVKDLGITTAKIDALAVTTAKIDNLAVTTGKIADDAVTDAKLRESSGYSVIGRAASSTGNPADITAGSASTALVRPSSGDLQFLAFGTLVLAGLLGAWTDPGFGDGKAGSITYAVNTTITEEIRATDINIDTGVTVSAPYPIRCTGTLSFDSSTAIIATNGGDASGSTAGTAVGNGYGSGLGGVNGAAGRSTVGNGTIGNSRTLSAPAMLGAANAGNGGAGGTSGANAGGGAGTATQPNATANGRGFTRPVVEYGHTGTAQVLFGAASGGSGGCTPGTGTATSGGGGAGGGYTIVWSRIVDASAGGAIQAEGGDGGDAAQTGDGRAGGGGGGGGGAVAHCYSSSLGLPTISVAPGTGGTAAGGGGAVDGSDGQAGASTQRVVP